MNLGLVGSRDFHDYNKFHDKIFNILDELEDFEVETIVSGGAFGTDKMAEKLADEYNYEKLILRPDWKQYGRGAGILRNTDIVENSDRIIVFVKNQSVGTWDTIQKAKDKCIPVHIVEVDKVNKIKFNSKPLPPSP